MTSSTDLKISKALPRIANQLEGLLQEGAGQPMSFSLVVYNTEKGSRLNYISNCDREDVIAVFKALVRGWEEGMPDIPAHEVQ